MSRSVVGFAALVLALATAHAAPRGKDKPQAPLYFPTTVGTKWVYQAEDKSESARKSWRSRRRTGDYHVTVGHSLGGKLVPERLVGVSETGLSVLAFNVADLSEPLVLRETAHAAGTNGRPSAGVALGAGGRDGRGGRAGSGGGAGGDVPGHPGADGVAVHRRPHGGGEEDALVRPWCRGGEGGLQGGRARAEDDYPGKKEARCANGPEAVSAEIAAEPSYAPSNLNKR